MGEQRENASEPATPLEYATPSTPLDWQVPTANAFHLLVYFVLSLFVFLAFGFICIAVSYLVVA